MLLLGYSPGKLQHTFTVGWGGGESPGCPAGIWPVMLLKFPSNISDQFKCLSQYLSGERPGQKIPVRIFCVKGQKHQFQGDGNRHYEQFALFSLKSNDVLQQPQHIQL